MSEANEYGAELLETLACEIGARPAGAPHFGDLERWKRGVRREDGALVVEYAGEAAETLEAVVEAERVCCAGIEWRVDRGATASGERPEQTGAGVVRLLVRAEVEQLDALAPLFGRPGPGTA